MTINYYTHTRALSLAIYIFMYVCVSQPTSSLSSPPPLPPGFNQTVNPPEEELYKLLICHQPFGSSKLEHSFSVSGE